jgi:phosphoenolpyruvate carboxylase
MLGFLMEPDGGYLNGQLSIYKAKKTAISRKYGVKVIFFDGRGGPPAVVVKRINLRSLGQR